MVFNALDKEYMRINGYRMLADKDNSGKGYVCPSCGSGTKEHGTGLRSKDGITYKCFACGYCGDIFDYVKVMYGIDKSFNKVAKLMHIGDNEPIKENIHHNNLSLQAKHQKHQQKKEAGELLPAEEIARKKEENKKMYIKAHKDIRSPQGESALSYLYNRGIDDNLIDKFKIGLKWNKYIVLPVTTDFYITRPIDKKIYYNNCLEGVKPFRNYTYSQLHNYDIVLVCEGIFDAMTALQLNIFDKVLSLNGAPNTEGFYKIAEDCKHKNIIYVIQMDADDAGEKAQQKICKTLDNKNILCLDSYSLHAIIKRLTSKKKIKDINECYLENEELTKEYFKKSYDMAKWLLKEVGEVRQNEKQEIA